MRSNFMELKIIHRKMLLLKKNGANRGRSRGRGLFVVLIGWGCSFGTENCMPM